MNDHDRPLSKGELRETAKRADELAGEARDDAALMRDGMANPDARPVYPPGLGVNDSPAVERADRVRRPDDEETFERQERLADAQARAAEELRESGERLERNRAELDRMESRVHDNAATIEDVERTLGRLREGVDRAGEMVRDLDVDDQGNGGGGR